MELRLSSDVLHLCFRKMADSDGYVTMWSSAACVCKRWKSIIERPDVYEQFLDRAGVTGYHPPISEFKRFMMLRHEFRSDFIDLVIQLRLSGIPVDRMCDFDDVFSIQTWCPLAKLRNGRSAVHELHSCLKTMVARPKSDLTTLQFPKRFPFHLPEAFRKINQFAAELESIINWMVGDTSRIRSSLLLVTGECEKDVPTLVLMRNRTRSKRCCKWCMLAARQGLPDWRTTDCNELRNNPFIMLPDIEVDCKQRVLQMTDPFQKSRLSASELALLFDLTQDELAEQIRLSSMLWYDNRAPSEEDLSCLLDDYEEEENSSSSSDSWDWMNGGMESESYEYEQIENGSSSSDSGSMG